MHGDCLELMKTIPDGSVDLILTDPPYGVITGGSNKNKVNKPSGILTENKQLMKNIPDFSDWIEDAYRVLKNSCHAYIMTNTINLTKIIVCAEKAGFKLVNILVWEKNNCTPSQYYMKNCEYTLLFRKGGKRYINNIGGSKTVHKFENIIGNKVHPTEKPISLMEFYVGNSSNEGDIILDMFMGGGSTGVAAKNLNRSFIGIELDDKYFEIARNRIESI